MDLSRTVSEINNDFDLKTKTCPTPFVYSPVEGPTVKFCNTGWQKKYDDLSATARC